MERKKEIIIKFNKEDIDFVNRTFFGISIEVDGELTEICLSESRPKTDDFLDVYTRCKKVYDGHVILGEATNEQIHELKQNIYKQLKLQKARADFYSEEV